MKSIIPKILLAVLILLTTTGQLLFAQTKGVVVDKVSRQPISYVSIYAKIGDKVFGTMTNDKGEFSVDFSFQALLFSHISYEKIEITKSELRDSVYLIPTTTMLTEVVVSSKKPKWIKSVLKKIVEQKNKNYQTTEKAFSYKYETYTLNDSNGYAFKSNGNLLIPRLDKNSQFKIDAQKNIIRYKDKTAGVDFFNLRRMLYTDFIGNFDNRFIENNNFTQNNTFENENPNIVQLMFTSKKYQDYEGYLVIDTLNNAIIEVKRNSGTNYNIHTQTSTFLRNLAKTAFGMTYNTWITIDHTKYNKTEHGYYIAECKYKYYMKASIKNKKVDKKYFTSRESQLDLDSKIKTTSKEMKVIPKPYYLISAMTKRMRIEEEALKKVPVVFEKF